MKKYYACHLLTNYSLMITHMTPNRISQMDQSCTILKLFTTQLKQGAHFVEIIYQCVTNNIDQRYINSENLVCLLKCFSKNRK